MDFECQILTILMVPPLSVELRLNKTLLKSHTQILKEFDAHDQSAGPNHVLVVVRSDMGVINLKLLL